VCVCVILYSRSWPAPALDIAAPAPHHGGVQAQQGSPSLAMHTTLCIQVTCKFMRCFGSAWLYKRFGNRDSDVLERMRTESSDAQMPVAA
jgi:hypothetical protein